MRERSIAVATSFKLFRIRTMSAHSIATSVPLPRAIPISACDNTTLSFTPSPTKSNNFALILQQLHLMPCKISTTVRASLVSIHPKARRDPRKSNFPRRKRTSSPGTRAPPVWQYSYPLSGRRGPRLLLPPIPVLVCHVDGSDDELRRLRNVGRELFLAQGHEITSTDMPKVRANKKGSLFSLQSRGNEFVTPSANQVTTAMEITTGTKYPQRSANAWIAFGAWVSSICTYACRPYVQQSFVVDRTSNHLRFNL